MKLIRAHYEILTAISAETILKNIEVAGRTCYKSEDKITESSATSFIRMLIVRGHESVLEHQSLSVRFVCDRGVSHELVRHRIASFSQESTRYCNYAKDKFDGQLAFIIPCWFKDKEEQEIKGFVPYSGLQGIKEDSLEYLWKHSCSISELNYKGLIGSGWTAQQARSVLPNSLKTEIVVTANLREWRTIFKQRTSKAAHPQMRELMCPLLDELKTTLPAIFEDISYEQ